jgi:hypothetical protein
MPSRTIVVNNLYIATTSSMPTMSGSTQTYRDFIENATLVVNKLYMATTSSMPKMSGSTQAYADFLEKAKNNLGNA